MAVLIKGKSIAGSKASRDHFLRGPENEHVVVRDLRGFATTDPDEALKMIELAAKGTKCERPLYSAKINPEIDRSWTLEEMFRAVDLLESNLGLTGHQRIIVEHKKEGRVHCHALWSRFPPEGGVAVHMRHDYAAHQLTQRQLEKEFSLKPMMAKGRDFKDSEVKWAQRFGFDIFAMREQITDDFNKAKSGQEFKGKMEAQGVLLCRGDKSQFVLILPWGQHKALSSMIKGRPTKAVLRRAMGDVDVTKLSTVSEGTAIVRARLPKRQVKAFRRVGHTYVRNSKNLLAAWKAGKQAVTMRGRLVAHPFSQPITQKPQEYQRVAHSAATIKDDFAREKRSLFYPLPPIDDAPPSFADIAYEEEYKKWSGLIRDALKDRSITREQRLAAVAALRKQQRHAAEAARKRVLEEERVALKAYRRAQRALKGLPLGPE